MNNREKSAPVQYVTPKIETMNERDILDEIGPAQAYTGNMPFSF